MFMSFTEVAQVQHLKPDGTKVSLDADKAVVLPSALGDGLFKQRGEDFDLNVDDWEITPDDLRRVDSALLKELRQNLTGLGLPTVPNYYRQYLPARARQGRAIFILGFSETASQMFPDRDIPSDEWKHKLMVAYGGGCAFWYAIYSMERRSFLILRHDGNRDRSIICNAPK